jgi:hypothetical protein
MEKEFIPYEQALALKELGFNKKCCAAYYKKFDNEIGYHKVHRDFNFVSLTVSAPLYQQAFRWFREKYKIFSCIMTEYSYGGNISAYHINGLHQSNISKGDFYNYEEAELACLKKLIEIVKNK